MTTDPRNQALKVLNRLTSGNLTLDAAIEQTTAKATFESSRDRALFNNIVYGTLRWRKRLDYMLAHFANRPIKKVDPRVLNALRLGLFQIAFLDRIPHSAAVNTTVNLVRTLGAQWAASFVNAVLRRASREWDQVDFPDSHDLSIRALAINKSFPDWLIERWISRFGADATIRLCDAINQPAAVTLRTNTLKTNRSDLLTSVRTLDDGANRADFAPDGIYTRRAGAKLFNHPVFQNGLCAVQDEAAQLVGLLINPQPGERVLDGCAGLGGKSGHMAQMMQNRGEVVAVDRSETRLKQLKTEMIRLGITIVNPLVLPLEAAITREELQMPFDRVLVDAPCSGLGVLKRNPDIKWSPLKSNLERYQKIQARLLDLAAGRVKPQGLLVYAVCSSEPEETEAVVTGFLKNHPEFDMNSESKALSESHYDTVRAGPYLQIYPNHVEMDGFFGVRFRRVK